MAGVVMAGIVLAEIVLAGRGRRAALALLLAGGLWGTTGCSPAPVDGPSARGSDLLAPFFTALEGLETGTASTVTVVHLGDSHTAGDRFSGRLRGLFQQRFGDGGRGFLPGAVPYEGYRPTGVTVRASGWTIYNSWTAKTPGLFGVSGFQAQAVDADAVMSLEPRDAGAFAGLEVEVIQRPDGGSLAVRGDGRDLGTLSTRGPAVAAERQRLDFPAPVRRIEVRPAGDGPVGVLAWGARPAGHGRGVVWESHGVVGSTVALLERWHPDTLARELGWRAPALLVLAFGTNEGFDDSLDLATYTALWDRQMTALRRAAPGAAVLVVGPPDAGRLPGACPGARRPEIRHGCAPLTAEETRRYQALFRGPRPEGAACRWHAPPRLAEVREAQRQIAARHDAAFWDWSEVMGAACGLHAWTLADPPLARRDHVHLSPEGYARSADALFTLLMRRYETWKGSPALQTAATSAATSQAGPGAGE